MKNQFDILGIKINHDTKEQVLEKIEKYVKNTKHVTCNMKQKRENPLIIFTPNPEIVMYAQKSQEFKQIVNSSQINIPDGVGLVWAGKIMGYPIRERISGADLLEKMVSLAEKEQATIGLIGGFGNLALSALECLRVKYPQLKGWAEDGPELRIKNYELRIMNDWKIDKFIKRVKETETRMLFVGFGCPKQEIFISEIAKKLDNIVLMAVGGTFAYLTGRIPRAPQWIQSVGMEWLYRLVKEPWRIKRQGVLPLFVLKIISAKIKNQTLFM